MVPSFGESSPEGFVVSEFVPGRVLRVASPILDGQRVIFWNFHLEDLSGQQLAAVTRSFASDVASAQAAPLEILVFALGDFNTPPEGSLRHSLVDPLSSLQAPPPRPLFRPLFAELAKLMEIEIGQPIHFSANTDTLATLDRIIVSLTPPFSSNFHPQYQ